MFSQTLALLSPISSFLIVRWVHVYVFLLSFAKGMEIDSSHFREFNRHDLHHEHSSVSSRINIGIHRTLLEAGFHRTLHTEISFHDRINISGGEFMTLVMVENITRDLYVDVDQLSSLYSMTGEPQVVVSDHMDTEKPAPLSKDHVLLVYLQLGRNRLSIDLPLHFRYQPPCDNSQYVPVTIPSPLLFHKVKDKHNSRESDDDSIKHLPCNCTSVDVCKWRRIEYKHGRTKNDNFCSEGEVCDSQNMGSEVLVAHVPCGVEHNSLLIVGMTVFVTLAAMVYLCHKIVSISYH